MKNSFLFLLVTFCVLALLVQPGCKNTDEAVTQYTLAVTLSTGVNGNPGAGVYTHVANDIVTYSYSAQSGYGNLTVTLDGTALPASGTITIIGNHTLNVTADVDIRGRWGGDFFWSGGDSYLEVTFSGGIFSGTASGQFDFKPGTGNGEYTVSGNQIEFILRYPDDSSLSGTATITDINNMNGNWSFSSPWGFEPDGTFSLERK
jgi:hypothetical protein